jgi:hypothetical protein
MIFICAMPVWALDADTAIQFVAKFAMKTIKSRNFQDLAFNLFAKAEDRKEWSDFLTKHELLKRSLPDIYTDGPVIAVKERSHDSTLDLSQLHRMKLIYNGQSIPFKGNETYVQIYLSMLKIHDRRVAVDDSSPSWLHGIFHGGHDFGLMPLFFHEADASTPVLAVVTLAAYAHASIRESMALRGVAGVRR